MKDFKKEVDPTEEKLRKIDEEVSLFFAQFDQEEYNKMIEIYSLIISGGVPKDQIETLYDKQIMFNCHYELFIKDKKAK